MNDLAALIRSQRKPKAKRQRMSDSDWILQNQPKTFEQWENWVRELGKILEPGVGLIFGHEPLTPGHEVPLKWSYDLYCLGCGRRNDGSFEPLTPRELSKQIRSFVIKASRAGGKTLVLTIVGFSLCRWNPNYTWNHTAAVIEQAERAWGYMKRLNDSHKFDDQINKFLKGGGFCEFNNNSEANIITGTEEGQNSKHPQLATYDEVEQMKHKIIREGKLAGIRKRTVSGTQLPPIFVYCSTQKKANETMFILLTEAKKGKHKLILADVFDVIEPCDDWRTDNLPRIINCGMWDEINADIDRAKRNSYLGQAIKDRLQELEHQRELLTLNCPLVEWCKGRAKQARGHYSIDDAIDKSKDRSYWLAQMMGEQPQMDHAVYATFSERENTTAEAIYQPECRIGAGIDYGFMQDPTYFFLWAENGPFYDMFYEEEIENVSGAKTPPLMRRALKKLGIKFEEVEYWCIDPSATELAAAMRDDGFNVIRSLGRRNKQLSYGIDQTSKLICDDGFRRLRINPDCVLMVEYLQVYEKRSDGLPKSGQYDHPPDALRYAAIYVARHEIRPGRIIHRGRMVGRTFGR